MRLRLTLTVFLLLIVTPPLGAAPPPPAVEAASAALIDAQTGRLLYGLAPHARRSPASTTKLMTALLVAETLTPDTLVLISPRAAAERSGSAIGLQAGERWRAGDLMRALLMPSANDAAIALAEGVAGTVEAFATLMNERAGALGARDTHFVTPHGRYHPQHYSSAYDLALMARAALRSPWIAEIARSQTWELRRDGTSRLLINTNKFLWRYPGADGVKTGWIAESGPCLVASATRGGWRLIAVVLDAPQMFRDATALLDYGFGAFQRVRGASRGEMVRAADVVNGLRPLLATVADDAMVVVRRGGTVTRQVRLAGTTAPIRRGEVVGSLVFTSGGVEVGRVSLVAKDSVPVRSLFGRLWQWVRGRPDGSSRP